MMFFLLVGATVVLNTLAQLLLKLGSGRYLLNVYFLVIVQGLMKE